MYLQFRFPGPIPKCPQPLRAALHVGVCWRGGGGRGERFLQFQYVPLQILQETLTRGADAPGRVTLELSSPHGLFASGHRKHRIQPKGEARVSQGGVRLTYSPRSPD